MEAMAMEVPVVANAITGIVELVDDGVSGFLVRPGRVDELTDRLARLLRDPGLRASMGRAGRAKVADEYDLSRMSGCSRDCSRLTNQKVLTAARDLPRSRCRNDRKPPLMCGICGIVAFSDQFAADQATVARMRDTLAHRGPDDAGADRSAGRTGCARPSPAGDHRPVAGGPSADGQRGRHGLDHLQRRGLQPRGAARRARGQGPPLPLAHRHRGDRPPLRGGGPETACERLEGMFALGDLGRRGAASCSSPATASASSRSTTRACREAWCSGRRSRRCSSTRRSAVTSTRRRSTTT